MAKFSLPQVTLCAASSVNVSATVSALQHSLDQIDFADCVLFTDHPPTISDPRVRVTVIPPLKSARDYSNFMLTRLANFIESSHCLVVQWDGFVLDANRWDSAFLSYDYIGASWPQFSDGFDVGNGGFSLRSRALLEACRDSAFVHQHPEDLAICRLNRSLLQDKHQIRFADATTASRFAFERCKRDDPTFGFHGVFNMIPALGSERFWQIYQSLDDRSTVFVDYRTLMGQLGTGKRSWQRRLRLSMDRLSALAGRRRQA